MARRVKKVYRPAEEEPPRKFKEVAGTEELQEVERFLQEMDAGEEGPELPKDGGAEEKLAEPPARPADDPRARWIAEGLRRTAAELERVEAGEEAGEDRGQVFYGVHVEKMNLLVRQDGMRAYLRGIPANTAKDLRTLRALEACGLAEIEVEAPRKNQREDQWIKVAQGQPPAPGKAGELELYCPSRPGETISFEALSLLSMELYQLFRAGGFDHKALPGIRALAVAAGEVLARISARQSGQPGQDVFGRMVAPALESPQGTVEPGWHVSLSEEGEYRAGRYGYLCLAEGKLSVLSPLWLDAGNIHAYWVLLDENPQPVTGEMVHQCLEDMGVVEGVQEERIKELTDQARRGQHQLGLHLIAQGAYPVNGEDAVVDLLVDLGRRAGKERPDGSVDFREVNFTPNVGIGQVVARRKPPRPGTPGRDVKGNALEPREGQDKPLKGGANIEVRLEDDTEVFAATIEGVVKQRGEELFVSRQLALKGDVNFDTGNLDFKGDVHVGGSVLQGFSVKATGDVSIGGTVEAASTVLALGDITVGKGIMGRRTRVQARGTVRAQFVQEGRVMAGRDIALGNYAYHAFLHAEGKIIVRKGAGARGGSILGGEAWGREGVEICISGSPTGGVGMLVAGLQPEQAQQLDKLKANVNTCHEHILKVLRRFNLTRIDLGQIRNMLAAATGPHRKVLVHHSRQLGQLVQLYQKMQADHAELESQIRTAVKGASIKMSDTAYAGTTIRIGEYQRKLAQDVKSPRFHIHAEKLVEG